MYKSISIDELYQRKNDDQMMILDVREADEFKNGHIPSAISMPLSHLGNHFTELKQTDKYYVICHSGARSEAACNFLSQQGLEVINVQNGMMFWKGEVI